MSKPLRLTWLDDGPYVITEPELVMRHFTHEVDGKTSQDHAVANIERKATPEEVEAWKLKR